MLDKFLFSIGVLAGAGIMIVITGSFNSSLLIGMIATSLIYEFIWVK